MVGEPRHSRRSTPTGRGCLATSESVVSKSLYYFRRLDLSRETYGMVILSLFLLMYVSSFYRLSSSRPDHGEVAVPEAVRAPAPTKAYLLLHVGESNGNHLPGAISIDGKKFESTTENEDQQKRDPNALPGAIGLSGAFDENENPPMTADSTPKGTELKPTTGNDGEVGTSKENRSAKGEKRKTSKRRKKKRVKSKQLRANDNAGESYTDESASKGATESNDTVSGIAREATGKSDSNPDNPDSTIGKKGRLQEGSSVKDTHMASDKKDEKGISSSDDAEKSNSGASDPSVPAVEGSRPLYDGPHPMNREMTELQVASTGTTFEETAVRSHYEKLVKAYLAPFQNGVSRNSFFDILRRRTYALSPPGSNKEVFVLDPYEVAKNSKPFYKTRLKELIWLLSEIVREGIVPDTEFLVAIHDCVQTVNRDHVYRGSKYKESSPTFTIVACNFSDNIPFPMWEGDPLRGGLKNWDNKMEKYQSLDTTPWENKEEKAVFRGGQRASMFFKNRTDADEHCDEVGRSRLAYLSSSHPDLFDVGVSGKCGGVARTMKHLSESDHHAFKYILYAEGNCFWADRLNKQIFGPSAIIKQDTPCGQFWEPLLKPMTHYIPTDFFFLDTVDQIKWAKENDNQVKEIVKNANDFAASFLTVGGIKTYVEVLLIEYTKLLNRNSISEQKGSVDVTMA